MDKLLAYALVWPLRAVTPFCFLAFPACLADWHYKYSNYSKSLGLSILLCVTGSEVFFYFWYRRALGLAQIRQPPPSTTRERRLELWKSIKESAVDNENPYFFLRSWFSVSSLEKISRWDLKCWLAWAIFDRKIDEISSLPSQQGSQPTEKSWEDLNFVWIDFFIFDSRFASQSFFYYFTLFFIINYLIIRSYLKRLPLLRAIQNIYK